MDFGSWVLKLFSFKYDTRIEREREKKKKKN